MKQVYPVIFTQLKDKKDTVLINVPDMDILTEGFGLSDAIEMAPMPLGQMESHYRIWARKFRFQVIFQILTSKMVLLTMMVLVMFHLWI